VLDWQPRGVQAKGAEIVVRVSDGPAPRTIPDLAGKTFDEAAAALGELGLTAVRADVFSDSRPAGQVDATVPPAGGAAAKGAKVTVNVSKGPDLVAVPNVSGQSVEQATATLASAGLQVANVFGPPRKTVFATDPEAGRRVKRGSGVSLYTR
jgi:serine/threonine-protein kinase